MWGIIFLLCLKTYISSAVYYNFGTDADLVCEYDYQSYSYWQKRPLVGGGYNNLQSTAGKYSSTYSKSLTIYNLTFEDTGYYRCTFYNGGWYNGQDQLLTVTEPGIWNEWTSWNACSISCGTGTTSKTRYCQSGVCIGDSTKTLPCTRSDCKVIADIGNEITLQCDNFALRQSYIWFKDGSQISENNKHKDVFSKQLIITSLNFDDGGVYRCQEYINDRWVNGQEQTLFVKGAPNVSIPQQTYFIRRGSSGTLTCTIHPKTNPNVTFVRWTRHADTSSQTTINSIPPKYGGGNLATPSLTINTASYTDDGPYSCVVQNSEGTTKANTLLITGDDPTINTSINNVEAEIAAQTILRVSIRATPSIFELFWYRDGHPINVRSDSRYAGGSITTPDLTIKSVSDRDDGIYKCSVRNYFGTNFVEITLLTWSVPSVALSGDRSIAIGETAIISGRVISKPSPNSITWKRGIGNSVENIDVRNLVKYETTGPHTNPVLKIKNITQSDSGRYTCVASNIHDSGSGTIDIVVGEKAATTIPVPYYVTIVGHNITLECFIKNDSSNTNLYWFKDGKLVNKFQPTKYSGGRLEKPSLTIKDTHLGDAGNYICKLKNPFGDSEDSVELKVLSAYVRGPLNIIQRANQSVTLACEASGGSRVIWRQNGKLVVTSNSLVYSGGTKERPSLTISNVTRYHAGNYTCETSIDSVTASSSSFLRLQIQDIPLVHPPQNNVQAITGSTIQLKCNHESYKKPLSVFWEKNGENLDVTSSKYNGSTINVPSLFIFNTEKTDSGKYVCGVRNDIGTGYSSEMQLIVKDPEETNSAVAPVVGGVVGAILVFVVVFLIVIVLKRRRSPRKKVQSKNKVNKKVNAAEQAISYRPDTKDKGEMYVNIGPLSSTDTDEDVTPTSILMKPNSHLNVKSNSAIQKKPYTVDDMKQKSDVDRNLDHGNIDSTYYNIESIITSIRVTELKDYIFKRQLKDELEEEYKKIPYGVQHPTSKAQQKENIPKNRFKTTFPYDHTRVVLESGHGMSSDYINANYVDGFENEKYYIASQGPVKHTINDHWRMIWQNNARKIIMLTNLVEGPKTKCERYWPDGGKPINCGNLILTLLTEKERAAYITREIEVEDKKTKEKRCIIQYHFTAWPDHGTPDPLYLVLFHKHVISDHTSTEHNGPLLVHCSAGIGRTGTYIGLDALYKEGRTTGFVDVVNFVKKMRYSRMNMVQTAGQYVCLHYSLLEAFTMKDTHVGKEEFGTIWQNIVLDKSPVNRQRLHEEFKMLEAKKSEHEKAQYVAATSPENVKKNRNKSIIPTDQNRLFLTSYDKGRTDYINAVQAPSYTKFVGYLTTQLPLPDTKVDFWTMVRDHNSSTIVVFLNDQAEADLVYSTSKDSFTCGKYSLTITNRGKEDLDVTSCKVILSKKDDKPREIALYLAVAKGLPDPQVLCKLVNLISTRVSMSHDPVSVVSGDGAKNCGVFCTFANAVSSMTIDNNANIFQLARLLQLRRPEFFSDFDEYRLCYEALNLYLESSSVYANF